MVAKQAGKKKAQMQLLKQELRTSNLEICRAMERMIQKFRSGMEERAVAQEPEPEMPIGCKKTRQSLGRRVRTPIYLQIRDAEIRNSHFLWSGDFVSYD